MITMNTSHIMIPLKIGNRLYNMRRFKHYSVTEVQSRAQLPYKSIIELESGVFPYTPQYLKIAYKEARMLNAPLKFLQYIRSLYVNYHNQKFIKSVQLIQKSLNTLNKKRVLYSKDIHHQIYQYPRLKCRQLMNVAICRIIDTHLQNYHLIKRLMYIKKNKPQSYKILLKSTKLSPKVLMSISQLLLKIIKH